MQLSLITKFYLIFYTLASKKGQPFIHPISFNNLGKNCDGVNFDGECCSVAAPCAINEGDCDSSYECQGNLTCGSNNCPAHFPSDANCCISSFGKEILWF